MYFRVRHASHTIQHYTAVEGVQITMLHTRGLQTLNITPHEQRI